MSFIGKLITWFILGVAALFALCEPVSADQFGVTPTKLQVRLQDGKGEVQLQEKTGYAGVIEVTSKGFPKGTTFEPEHVVVAGTSNVITVTIQSNATVKLQGFLRLKPATGESISMGLQLPLTIYPEEVPLGPIDFQGHEKQLTYMIVGVVVAMIAGVISLANVSNTKEGKLK
jgi:hypothetical protein